jgi:hypothetical protein
MRTWLQSHRGRSFIIGAVAIATVGGLAYVVAGPLDAFGASGGGTAAPAAATSMATRSPAVTGGGPTYLAKDGALTRPKARSLIRRLLRRSVHASFVVKEGSKGYVTVTLDKGKVQSVSTTSITVLRADGVTVTTGVTSTTKFLRTTESTLTAGERVVLVEVGGDARYVVAVGRGAAKGAVSPPRTA